MRKLLPFQWIAIPTRDGISSRWNISPWSSASDKQIAAKIEDALTKVIEGMSENEVSPVYVNLTRRST